MSEKMKVKENEEMKKNRENTRVTITLEMANKEMKESKQKPSRLEVISNILNKITKKVDDLLEKHSSKWSKISKDRRELMVAAMLAIVALLLSILVVAIVVMNINHTIRFATNFIKEKPDTVGAIILLFIFLALLHRQLRRHGMLVTTILLLILLLLMKYASTFYTVDTTYLDEALKGILRLPEFIGKTAIPWFVKALHF